MSPRRRLATLVCGLLVATATTWTIVGPTLPAAGQDKEAVIHRVVHGEARAPTFLEPIFILLLGGDAREGNPELVRMDAIHILGIDPVRGRASLLGIPRDSWVEIPGSGSDKIAHAGFYGGADLMVDTVERRSGCRFDYYLLTSFPGFVELIDEIGGIEFDVPEAITSSSTSIIDLEPGTQTLNGREALSYARVRKGPARPEGDISRSAAQNDLLVAALIEMRGDVREKPRSLLRALGSMRRWLRMDIPLADAFRLGQAFLQIEPSQVTTGVVDNVLDFVGDVSVVQITDEGGAQFVDICSDGLLGQ